MTARPQRRRVRETGDEPHRSDANEHYHAIVRERCTERDEREHHARAEKPCGRIAAQERDHDEGQHQHPSHADGQEHRVSRGWEKQGDLRGNGRHLAEKQHRRTSDTARANLKGSPAGSM